MSKTNRLYTGIALSLVLFTLVDFLPMHAQAADGGDTTSDTDGKVIFELGQNEDDDNEEVTNYSAMQDESVDFQLMSGAIVMDEPTVTADTAEENEETVNELESSEKDNTEVMQQESIAEEENEQKISTPEPFSGALYTVPINTAFNLSTAQISEGLFLTVNIEHIDSILAQELVYPEWDTRKRFKDIQLLSEILMNEFGVSPTKTAAILGNVCYEDSFIALTGSAAHSDNLENLRGRLGKGTRGFGVIQWTSSKRQKPLLEYYERIYATGLDWEHTSVVAEAAYLYNELYVSGLIGNLSEDGDLEDLTGRLGVQYEAYGKSDSEWSVVNGLYRTSGSSRYTYAQKVYQWICEEGI